MKENCHVLMNSEFYCSLQEWQPSVHSSSASSGSLLAGVNVRGTRTSVQKNTSSADSSDSMLQVCE